MQKPKNFKFKVNLTKIAQGMRLTKNEAKSFFNDGRIVGRYAEFVVQNKGLGKRAKSEGSAYDNDMKDGQRLEVRSITKHVSFASSKEVGYGRKVTQNGWIEKLNAVDVWCLVDFENLEEWQFIFLTTAEVKEMAERNVMGKNRNVSRKKFLAYLTENNLL